MRNIASLPCFPEPVSSMAQLTIVGSSVNIPSSQTAQPLPWLGQLDQHCQSSAQHVVELLNKQNQLLKEKHALTEEMQHLRIQYPGRRLKSPHQDEAARLPCLPVTLSPAVLKQERRRSDSE
ncbi:UNVERIFIED_CONTAM: hypothetical protein FKN15_071629 [Acipenser sinensis]